MAGTARKGKKGTVAEVPAFILPDSLPCSEVEFPILLTTKAHAKWETILIERENHVKEIEEFKRRGKQIIPRAPFLSRQLH